MVCPSMVVTRLTHRSVGSFWVAVTPTSEPPLTGLMDERVLAGPL
jgi:hypothetical protein